jgi:hypothetical protein
MSFQRHQEKTRAWREWLRLRHDALLACGLPPAALRSELDWLVFLDHGYVQSATEPPPNWWSIHLLAPVQARHLASFIEREYEQQYPLLVANLRRIGAADRRVGGR